MYLREIKILRENMPTHNAYPFNVPALRNTERIALQGNVTFFVGENGSGKSTLLEAIAYQCDFNTAGGSVNNKYEVRSAGAALGDHLRLSWLPRMKHGFFLRAESFYSFASYLDQMAEEMPGEQYNIYRPYGGKSLHEQSHGESFLSLFKHRFGGKGIYLLDEPEAALSPARQLALLSILHELRHEAQFIIATHSPILLGYPDAQIFNFDESPVSEIRYEETSHYQITRRFLENRQFFLRELMDDGADE